MARVNNSTTYNAEALKRIKVTINGLLEGVDTLSLNTNLSLTGIGDTARKAKSTADWAIKLAKNLAAGGGPYVATVPDMSVITAHLLADDDFKAKLCSTLATGLNMLGYVTEAEVDSKIAAASLTRWRNWIECN